MSSQQQQQDDQQITTNNKTNTNVTTATTTSTSETIETIVEDEKETTRKQQIWFHEISEKLQLLSLSNDLLKEKNLNLLQQQDQTELKLESYKQELDSKNTLRGLCKIKEGLRVRDANIDSLTIQLEIATNRVGMLSESLRDLGDRTNIFDRDESFNISSASKQLLDYQKILAYQKIKSVEEKYGTIKNINLGLQKTIQELSLENEKYKYSLEALKNQNR
ncbi:hypothetical protein DFA_01329 [Cavenderia fasciculata]|uniref:Uncharacterized protein n=1 Tax=Cavenderia fasciculata TaxID=261658 RepID=F4PS62_CACFS|nr:uncharacterized protein DFA_01329 [Cavenderia fasciculata]EGG21445.1 hypothetical protein DFA_01329 [Cavenderia fasciculata]|eukprot:XP_004359295.1 hypothetical protein DFA_01329 [Cavenderia fasciculata]